MPDAPESRNSVFISYSHADRRYLDELLIFLAPVRRDLKREIWVDTRLKPGDTWREEIARAVASAQVAIVLVSAAFRASKFIAENELPPLLAAAKSKDVLIVPVVVGTCDYDDSELADVQAINDPTKPLNDMRKSRREREWLKVARQVKDAVNRVPTHPANYAVEAPAEPPSAPLLSEDVNVLIERAYALVNQKKCDEALVTYDRALALDPNAAEAWVGKGWALIGLDRYNEALAVFERALALDPSDASFWTNRGLALSILGHTETALVAFDHALALDPNDAVAWTLKGDTLSVSDREEEALAAYDRALALDPKDARGWVNKGTVLHRLARHEDALAAYERAVDLNPNEATAWSGKASALRVLGRDDEADAAHQRGEELWRTVLD